MVLLRRRSFGSTLSGSTLADDGTKTEADLVDGEVTFSADIEFLEFFNGDTSNAATLVVNGVTAIVPPGGLLEVTRFVGTPAKELAVAGSTSFLASRYV